ncbi:MAG: hypothetical protein IPM45_14280 [Acidimicrobiales bacterium]|nr:hypothetical protein [Acidimicrobiales bacterium]
MARRLLLTATVVAVTLLATSCATISSAWYEPDPMRAGVPGQFCVDLINVPLAEDAPWEVYLLHVDWGDGEIQHYEVPATREMVCWAVTYDIPRSYLVTVTVYPCMRAGPSCGEPDAETVPVEVW